VQLLIYSGLCSLTFVLGYVRTRRRKKYERTLADTLVILWGAGFAIGQWLFLGIAIVILGNGFPTSGWNDLAWGALMIGPPGLITAGLLGLASRSWFAPAGTLFATITAVAVFVSAGDAGLVLAPLAWNAVVLAVLLIDAHRWRKAHRFLICLNCGYDLRGLGGASCPECGGAP
jgi:hypothetical protein